MNRDQTRKDAREAILEAANAYLGHGWQPLPVPYESKNPNRKGWQAERRTAADLDADFGRRLVNVGLLTGDPSGGLLDVDVDSVEALRLATTFLPETDAVFGRDAKPASHWLYVADMPGQTKQFKAPDGAMLVEYRATGSQTIAPPSVTSQSVRWDRPGEPRRIDAALLLAQVGHLAAAALLAREWPKQGGRHVATLALAGGLLRSGWSEDDAAEFVVAVASAAGDEEANDRAANVRTTARRLADNATATGWKSLRDIMGDKVVQKVCVWIGGEYADETGPPSREHASSTRYSERDGKLFWIKPSGDGTTWVQLTNFTASIVSDVVRDDGAETRREIEIEGELRGRRYRFQQPADTFHSMAWPIKYLGSGAVVEPGMGLRDRARAAIQELSGEVPERVVYGHIGWREIEGQRVYLHAGGALGKDGPIEGVEVFLGPPLDRYALPVPPSGNPLAHAIQASLRVLTIAPDAVTAPVLGVGYRAPLARSDFGLFIAGPTGAGKSELGALLQQHFGAGMDRPNLPGSWSSTGNALESLAFLVKDAPLVVDDFAPTGSQSDIQRYHRDADRLLRSQGNTAGRHRLRSDTTLRAARAPRGIVVSTGEDVPRGQSARARILILEVERSMIRLSDLTPHQDAASAGLFAQATAGYICWLARREGDVEAAVRADVRALRAVARDHAAHARTPEIVANLATGWRWWLSYAVDTGAVSESKAQALWDRVWSALGAAAAAQTQHQHASEPTARFLELLSSALATGRAHVASPRGDEPREAERWGWRQRIFGTGENTREEWQPQGKRIGWVDDGGLYLDPDGSFVAAQEVGNGSGDPLPVQQKTLGKRLAERGLLASVDKQRKRNTVRRDLEGIRRNVLHFAPDIFDAGIPSESTQSTQST